MVKSMLNFRFFMLVASLILLGSEPSFSAVDWSLEKGRTYFAELKLPKSVFETAFQRGGVAQSQSDLGEWVQFQRYESPEQQGLVWNSLQYHTNHWNFKGRIYQYDDLQGVNSEGDFTGDYGSSINDISLGYRNTYQKSQFEIELHYLDSRVAQAYSQGGYVDLSLRSDLNGPWVYGWKARNIGFSSEYDRREVFLPIQVVTGVVYQLHSFMPGSAWQIEPGVDIEYQNDEGASLLGGLGVNFQNTLVFRTSLRLIDPEGEVQWLPTQAGMHLNLDFGFIGYGYRNLVYLGGAHLIEFGVKI